MVWYIFQVYRPADSSVGISRLHIADFLVFIELSLIVAVF